MCVLGDHVPEQVVVGLTRNENATFMQVETGDDRRRGGGNTGSQPGKKIGPFITRETYVGTNVGEVGVAQPRVEGVGDFPENVCTCVRVESAATPLNGIDFLESGATVREDNQYRGGAGIY